MLPQSRKNKIKKEKSERRETFTLIVFNAIQQFFQNTHSERPNQFSTEESRQQFKHFLTILSNVTFENFEDVPMNNTFGISSEDYMQLLFNLSAVFDPEISSGTSTKLYMIDTITELGFCHSVNTKVAGYNSYG